MCGVSGRGLSGTVERAPDVIDEPKPEVTLLIPPPEVTDVLLTVLTAPTELVMSPIPPSPIGAGVVVAGVEVISALAVELALSAALWLAVSVFELAGR